MIPPRQSYQLCSGPYSDVRHCPGAVSSQSINTTWPYLPNPKVSQGHLLSPYVQGYIDYSEDYVAHSGFPTNIGLRFTEFNSYDVSNNWIHSDDSHRVQEMRPQYHGFYRDQSGIGHSTHQTQETTALTCTQDFGCVSHKSPRPLQAQLQKSENADLKTPAHQAVDLHDIPDLPPIESSIDRSHLPLQSSGHPGSSQVFPTDSRGSSPENSGFGLVWGSSYFLSSAPEQEASSIIQGT